MRKEIIINATANEIRIAITEDRRLAELYVETPEKERLVGDIFLGKVAKVMPGIRAAFVELGLKQDAFLHFSDIGDSLNEYSSLLGEDSDVDTDEGSDEGEEGSQPGQSGQNAPSPDGRPVASAPPHQHQQQQRRGGRDNGRGHFPIPDIQKGQDIIVQVTKEPVGKKGVRITSEISLPGRFLVLLPFDGKIGISKKLNNFKEKRRLRHILRGILPPGFGVIVRTVAHDQDEATLRQDLESLLQTWKEIQQTLKNEKAPAVLYKDMATTSSVIRDLFTDSVERVVVDSKKLHKEIRSYLEMTSPALMEKVELYREREPIFDAYGIEKEIAVCLSPKVWMKSGGYLIIEQTEAMVVVDVNSGRYAAKREQELNSLRTDLEAARELCRQLRLRDLGGIIVADFIDLEDERNRKKVYDELRKEFRKDRAKVTVLPMTEIGLVQVTRQRIRQSVLHSFSEACPVCGGGGLVQTRSSVVNQIERGVRRFKAETREFRLQITVHPTIADYLREGSFNRLRKMMLKYRLLISIEAEPRSPASEFKFYSPKQDKDITQEFKG
ncbi:MAG TPA: Rne/Rng family ribonuclease [Bacteroidota bacterium]|nr:Rne/Rng family ribonuclease [Bacteroidota bacterium]